MPRPKPPFPPQSQSLPGSSRHMQPEPDYGEDSYQGSGRLQDKKAVITGPDSGIGRAVALAFAREGAKLVIVTTTQVGEQRRTISMEGGNLVVETSQPGRDGGAPTTAKLVYKKG